MTTIHRLGPLAAALTLLASTACTVSAGEETAAPPDASAIPASSVTSAGAEPSTSQASSSSTSAPSTSGPSTSGSSTSSSTTTRTTSPVPDGSGCDPGPGELPDGTWYGNVVDAGPESIEFDLACYFTGEDAILAAAEDGAESPPPNDYHIRNTNDTTRTIRIELPGQVTWYPDFGDPGSEETIDYAGWVAALEERGVQPGVWLSVDDGRVRTIEEQWVP